MIFFLQILLLFECNLMRIRYAYKDRKYLRPLYDKTGEQSDKPGMIIAMCDGRIGMGGLCDRLHGIISLYQYCRENNIPFKVNFCEPFRLKEYLEPNEVDWDIEPQALTYNLTAAHPIRISLGGIRLKRHSDFKWRREHAFIDRYINSLLKNHPQKELHIYTNMHRILDGKVYSQEFNKLFKVSKPLAEAIAWNKEQIGGKYISVTLRFQSLLGDFKERNFPTIDSEAQEQLIADVKAKLDWLHATKHPNDKILVTSDSRKFLDEVDNLDYVYTIPGKLVHMSYTPVHDFATHLKSFVDLMMLADAEKLYLLVTGEMYQSGFAQSASFINNRPYEVIRW